MKEIILPGQHGLTQIVKKLNKAFIVLKRMPEKERKQFLKKFCTTFSEAHAPSEIKKVWTLIEEKADRFDEANDVVDPLIVLRDYGLSPYIGDLTHGVMFCKGMTIGLELPLTKNMTLSYRLDFAPDKLLHFNCELRDGNSEKYPLCIPLRFSTGRFGFTHADKLNCEHDERKTSVFLEATKAKFWLKMTIANTLIAAPMNEIDHTKSANEQLFNFLRGNTKYDLTTIKAYLIERLPQDMGKARIRACQTEQELLTCIMQKPVIRATARESIFETIAAKDESRRLLRNQEQLVDAMVADSDQRIDSEQPPAQRLM